MNIVTKLINYNFTSKPNRKFDYICIHDTGNRSIGAGALMHYLYFNSGNKSASADFFVDDQNILQLIDIDNAYSWAVGDGAGRSGITNSNSISIEICINPDSNYDVTINNTIDLVVYLMKQYNIPLEKVVRHFDASGKNCPQSMNNNGDWSMWNEFKQKVADKINYKEVVYKMFKDENEISDYAKESVERLYSLGLMKGDTDGKFNPMNPIKRQDFAVVINYLLKMLGK